MFVFVLFSLLYAAEAQEDTNDDACLYPNSDLPGGTILVTSGVTSVFLCVQQCVESEACEAVVWLPNKEKCLVKNGSYSRMVQEGWVAAPEGGAGVAVIMSCLDSERIAMNSIRKQQILDDADSGSQDAEATGDMPTGPGTVRKPNTDTGEMTDSLPSKQPTEVIDEATKQPTEVIDEPDMVTEVMDETITNQPTEIIEEVTEVLDEAIEQPTESVEEVMDNYVTKRLTEVLKEVTEQPTELIATEKPTELMDFDQAEASDSSSGNTVIIEMEELDDDTDKLLEQVLDVIFEIEEGQPEIIVEVNVENEVVLSPPTPKPTVTSSVKNENTVILEIEQLDQDTEIVLKEIADVLETENGQPEIIVEVDGDVTTESEITYANPIEAIFGWVSSLFPTWEVYWETTGNYSFITGPTSSPPPPSTFYSSSSWVPASPTPVSHPEEDQYLSLLNNIAQWTFESVKAAFEAFSVQEEACEDAALSCGPDLCGVPEVANMCRRTCSLCPSSTRACENALPDLYCSFSAAVGRCGQGRTARGCRYSCSLCPGQCADYDGEFCELYGKMHCWNADVKKMCTKSCFMC